MVDPSGITSSITNFKLNVDYVTIVYYGKIMGWIFAIVAAIIVLWFFVLRPMSYKINVMILNRLSGGQPQFDFDRGKYVKSKGSLKFVLLKRSGLGSIFGYKLTLNPPDNDNLVLDTRGRKNLVLEQFSPLDFKQMHVADTFQNSAFIPIDADVKLWASLEMKQAAQKYTKQSFFEKYGGMLLFLCGMVLCVVLLWMTLGKVSEISGSMAQAADRMAAAVSDFGKQIVNAGGG